VFGELCARCKGRLWCGLPKCPILESAKSILPKLKLSKDSLFGPSPPSVFVGRFGYPNVYAGPLVSESQRTFSSSSELYGKSLDEILKSTSSLVRASKKVNVRHVDKIVETSQEIALSEKPIDTEIWIEKFYGGASVDDFFHPTGPRIEPRKIDIVDNPSIPRKVDMVVEERLKAEEAIRELYANGYNVDYLQRLMASGVLGKDRKLVPTRWSITAVDDIAFKGIIKDVKNFDTINSVEYYFENFMGNKFHIFLIPGIWEYEMLETWLRGSLYSSGEESVLEDYEPYEGRKNYASNITGAYYAARLAVAEHLKIRRRQAKVLIYREITPDYRLPLGVWVIRESVRHALMRTPLKFENVDDALKYAEGKTHKKGWHRKSRIIYNLKHQRRIDDFIGHI
jgi:hypothetical protein